MGSLDPPSNHPEERKLKRTYKLLILELLHFSCVLVLIAGTSHAAISITATGIWFETINSADLQAGAGSDLTSAYESAADAASISVSGTGGTSDNWRIDVKKTDTTWHSSLHLYVKRTSDGTGSGSISGGTSYQEAADTDQSFFSGAGDRSGADIQLRLTGVSVQIPPDAYSATVYYTVVDTE